MQTVASISVRCPSIGRVIGTLLPRGESFLFKPAAEAVKIGMIPGPSHIEDFKRAALYLVREPASVSAVVGGYTVEKASL